MDPYRKLLVLGLNALLTKGDVSLDGKGLNHTDNSGHLATNIAGHPSIVAWTDIGFEELRISVWWKYDHARHPQANMEDNFRESFSCSTPLAKRSRYREFVGVCASGWLERKAGKYLQGKGRDCIFDIFTRRGELPELEAIPDPKPNGYAAEGKFHI